MPYNYLIDSSNREGFKLDLENAILIVDEAHNIKSFAEESSNFIITLEQLKNCLKELEWIEGSLSEDQNTGPGIDITRSFINHWSNFIQHKKHAEGIIEITASGFPPNSIVL